MRIWRGKRTDRERRSRNRCQRGCTTTCTTEVACFTGSGTKKEKKAGWWTSDDTKTVLIKEIETQVKTGGLVLRSRELESECGQYIAVGGKPVHALKPKGGRLVKGKGSRGPRNCSGGCSSSDVGSTVDVDAHETEVNVTAPAGSMAERLGNIESRETMLERLTT